MGSVAPVVEKTHTLSPHFLFYKYKTRFQLSYAISVASTLTGNKISIYFPNIALFRLIYNTGFYYFFALYTSLLGEVFRADSLLYTLRTIIHN